MKRWFPRYSIRTLAIIITLVSCYAAGWGPTKTQGLDDVAQHAGQQSVDTEPRLHVATSAKLPLLVTTDELEFLAGNSHSGGVVTTIRSYYFWLFGYVVRLPWEREVDGVDSASATYILVEDQSNVSAYWPLDGDGIRSLEKTWGLVSQPMRTE